VSKQWGVAGCSVAEPVMLCDELTTPVGGGDFRQDGDEMHLILLFTDSMASISRWWWYHYSSECQSSWAKSGGDQQIIRTVRLERRVCRQCLDCVDQ
jgi:hypothetical protein